MSRIVKGSENQEECIPKCKNGRPEKSQKVNWSEIFTDRHTEAWYKKFSSGDESARSLEMAFRFSEAAGPFRKLIRSKGVSNARTLVRKALSRRLS
jgi:hypothetical protein